MLKWNRHLMSRLSAAGLVLGVLGSSLSCQKNTPPAPQKRSYPNLGLRPNLPNWLKGTVLERVDLSNTGAMMVTSYGLVVNLRYTGDTRAPVPVREWITKEMVRHGFGSLRMPGYSDLTPERMLNDKRNAIVTVGAFVQPGARKGQKTDVLIQALPGNDTSSLAGGTLYECELRLLGANPMNPGGSVNTYVKAAGPLFINPAYALEVPKATDGSARAGARMATILGGGVNLTDRPLHLRLRTPQWAISRNIEDVINTRFQAEADKPRVNGRGMCVTEAQDDGYLYLYVPGRYQGNWQHFVGVVTHLYVSMSPGAAAVKSQELASEAVKPGALLEDVSYALEGLGPVAIPAITKLLGHSSPDVVYAAARAGAFLGDTACEDVLIKIAQQNGHPFRVNAIVALGELPFNAEINRSLSTCLDADESSVRVEAYKVLCRTAADTRLPSPIISKSTGTFLVDMVQCNGKPMVYANRVGEPRIAIFGPKIALKLPITFSAFDSQLTIASHSAKPGLVSVFYRGPEVQEPVSALSRPLVAELATRLGGGSDDKLRFGYGEVVAILQSLADSGKLSSAFVLQDLPGLEDDFVAMVENTGSRRVGEPAAAPATRPLAGNQPPGQGSPQPRPN